MKKLKALYQNKCTGCELCVMESQRQLRQTSLDGAYIRVFRKKSEKNDYLDCTVEIDPRVNNQDMQKIREICPTRVLEVVEEENEFGV